VSPNSSGNRDLADICSYDIVNGRRLTTDEKQGLVAASFGSGLSVRDFATRQTLTINPPKFLVVHMPALSRQHHMQAAITKPPALMRQRLQACAQKRIIRSSRAISHTGPIHGQG